MLAIRDLETSYGRSQVLFRISIDIGTSQVVSLLGRNGMGKTTTVRSIMGLTRAQAGSIRFRDRPIEREAPDRIARLGIALVPEGRQIFPNLSVWENLAAFADNRSQRADPWTPERVFEMFPNLKDRKDNSGNQLSGGEQQMLAIGRALVLNPRLLLLDEPTEGLAPIIVEELLRAISRIVREEGLSAVIVEQHAAKILKLTDEAVVLDRGSVVHASTSAHLLAHPELLAQHLGVSG